MKIKKIYEQVETFLRGSNLDGEGLPVYKNPTRKEVLDACMTGSARFFIDDKNKNVYVFDAFNLTHLPVARSIDERLYNLEILGEGFSGRAILDKSSGILVAMDSDGLRQAIKKEYFSEVKKILKNPRRWNKWIDCDMLLAGIQRSFKQALKKSGEEWEE